MAKRRISRREFLYLGAASSAAALLTACGQSPTTPTAVPDSPKPATAPTKAPAAEPKPAAPTAVTKPAAPVSKELKSPVVKTIPKKFNDPPMLAELVKAGKLPPIDQRLPEEPLVVQPFDEIGSYGGTFRDGERATARWGPGFSSNEHVLNYFRNLLNQTADNKGFEPGVAKDWKISDDQKTYTLTLRKGLKFSDGKPFTSKDVLFWYEDILLNKEITPSVDQAFRQGNEVMKIEAPDDYTLVFKHAAPYPSFILLLAQRYTAWGGHDRPLVPAHYLKPFHIKYNSRANDDAKAEKYESWVARFTDKLNADINKDLPSLRPFIPVSDSPTTAKEERNPYYWVVDTEGNQLPYIDYHENEHLTGNDAFTAKAVTGVYDFGALAMSIMQYQAYKAGEKNGNYTTQIWQRPTGSEVYYAFNLTCKDLVQRKIFQDVRFRRACSLAINREEINQLIYFGQATPRQMTVVPYCRWFKPEYEKAWADFDVTKADALLDEMGLKWDSGKKWRLRPDGNKLSFNLDQPLGSVPATEITELVSSHWQKIGVELTQKKIAQPLLQQRLPANEQDITLWIGLRATDIMFPVDAWWIIGNGLSGMDNTVAVLWNQWLDSQGKQGEEPPDWWKEHYNNYKKFQQTLDDGLAEKVLKFQAENVICIGTVGMGPQPMIVRNNLRNVAGPKPVWGGDYNFMTPYHSEMWYFKK